MGALLMQYTFTRSGPLTQGLCPGNWKKAPDCFKDQQYSKCHKGPATLAVIVPSCGDFENKMFENMVKVYNGKPKV